MPAELTIDHEAESSRYVLRDDGATLGYLAYRERDDVVDVYTTVIRPEHRGQGLGAVLVRAALDHLRTKDRQIVPSCWYVADFMAAEPDYRSMRAG